MLDLGSAEFRNNRWHQCSATYEHTDADASNVTISVVNLNTNAINTGNDMSLDRRVEIIVVVQKNQKIAKE